MTARGSSARSRIAALRLRPVPASRVGRVEAMRAHVGLLVVHHRITAEPASRSGGRAFASTRTVAFGDVRSETTYAVALHEIGHLVGPGRSGRRLEREAAAWRWALGAALPWATTETFCAKVRDCLESYRAHAERRGGGPGCPRLPDDDHDFWPLLEHGRLP